MYNLLIVEDEPVMRQGLIQLLSLEKYGYRLCGEVENGMEALERIEALRPDVVITDIRMPLMDGMELIKRAMESGWPVPKFIILSGHRDFEYARNALRYGVSDYLLKPVDEDELIELLKKIAKELRKEDQKRFREAAMQVLAKSGEAAEENHWSDVPGCGWQGPYRFIGVTLNEAFRREHRGRVMSLLDEVGGAGAVVSVQGENGPDLGLVLAGQALQEIGDDWGSFVDALNAGLSSGLAAGLAAASPEPYLYIGEQVDQLQSLYASYRTAEMAGNAGVLADRRYTVSNRAVSLNATNVIGEIEQFIREHYSKPITLKEMGKANYMHPNYLGQLFKKTTGLHFKDYLHKVRIDAAKQLLRKSEMKVYEVADSVGYVDQEYFMGKFKRHAGMTPTQYREKLMAGSGTG